MGTETRGRLFDVPTSSTSYQRSRLCQDSWVQSTFAGGGLIIVSKKKRNDVLMHGRAVIMLRCHQLFVELCLGLFSVEILLTRIMRLFSRRPNPLNRRTQKKLLWLLSAMSQVLVSSRRASTLFSQERFNLRISTDQATLSLPIPRRGTCGGKR